MNWLRTPVQGMHSQHWPTHYTAQSLTLFLSYSLFHPPIITPFVSCLHSSTRLLFCLPTPSFCPSCPSAHLAFPSLFGQESPRRRLWMGRQCLCLSVYSFGVRSVYVERKRRRRRRHWVKDVSQVPAYTSACSLIRSWQCQAQRGDLLSVTQKDLWQRTHWPQWLYNNWPTFGDPDSYFHSVSLAGSLPSLDV